MKKILSLLSVLTISGTAVPTTIAASPYQKEEINSYINYLQSNNLEKLNIVKRWDWFDRNIGDKLGDATNSIKNKLGDAANTVKDVVVKGGKAVVYIVSDCLGNPNKIVNTAKKFVTSYEGGAMGAGAGATSGAAIGSAVPGIGTVIGTGAGAQTIKQCANIN